MSPNVLVILHFVRSRFKCSCFRTTLLTVLRTVYAIGRISSGLIVQARPSFDPPCGSHQLPVILKYSILIFGTQLSQFLLVGTLPAGITSLHLKLPF